MSLIYFLATCYAACSGVSKAAQLTTQSRLVRDLLQNYDPEQRPVLDAKTPVEVDISPYFQSYRIEIEGGGTTLIAALRFLLLWKDELIHWNPAEYDGLARLMLSNQQVWTPPIMIRYKSRLISSTGSEFMVVELDAEGNMSGFHESMFKVPCKHYYKLWPIDQITCDIQFYSTEDPSQLRYKFDREQYEDNITLTILNAFNEFDEGQWSIPSVTESCVKRSFLSMNGTMEIFCEEAFQLTFLRIRNKYFDTILAPFLIMFFVAWLTLYLRNSSYRIILLSISIYYQIKVFQILCWTIKISVGKEVLIMTFFTNLIAMDVFLLVMTVLNFGLQSLPPRSSRLLSPIMDSEAIKILLYKWPEKDNSKDVIALEEGETNSGKSGTAEMNHWTNLSLILDRLLMLLIPVLFFLNFISFYPK